MSQGTPTAFTARPVAAAVQGGMGPMSGQQQQLQQHQMQHVQQQQHLQQPPTQHLQQPMAGSTGGSLGPPSVGVRPVGLQGGPISSTALSTSAGAGTAGAGMPNGLPGAPRPAIGHHSTSQLQPGLPAASTAQRPLQQHPHPQGFPQQQNQVLQQYQQPGPMQQQQHLHLHQMHQQQQQHQAAPQAAQPPQRPGMAAPFSQAAVNGVLQPLQGGPSAHMRPTAPGFMPASAPGPPMMPPRPPVPGLMPGGVAPGPGTVQASALPGPLAPMQPGGLPPPPGAFSGPAAALPPLPGAGFPGTGPVGMPGPPPGVTAGYDAYAGQKLVEQFEALTVSSGPSAMPTDAYAYPHPAGLERAVARSPQQPYHPGNCSSDNMRPTVMGVPASTALRMRWHLPLGVVVRPMADEACGRTVPIIPLGSQGIVRCRRCRTYMNPFCSWVDGGRRFKCNVCGMMNEVPVEYFSTLDGSGGRRDVLERPELSCGTVEWVAPQEYMVRPPMPPVYFFCIDVSQAAYACGLVEVVCNTIKACLDKLPGDERTLVGFLTYDSSLHFYNIKPTLSAPQVLVVGEVADPFLPLPDDLLVNLKDSRPVIEALLEALPHSYSNTATSNDCAMGPALQAAFLVLGHVGGKLLLFQAGLPSLGPGTLKPSRDNLNLYNTDKEPTLRVPEDPFFKSFAGEASSRQITLDIFLGTNGYADLASLSHISKYTCGQVYHYPGFHAPRDGMKLSAELQRNLTRPTAWEAVMRIRCSRGLKISSFHGHFFNRSTDLLALPTCDPDKVFGVQISHEETLVSGPVAYVQCALLYTNSNGERRIRVHTMMLPVLSELSELYRACDGAAIACLLAKLGVEKSHTAKLDDSRQALLGKLSLSLKEYRLLHSAHVRTPGALIYPSTLKYLPVYLLGLIKATPLKSTGRDVPADVRSAAAHALMSATVDDTLLLAYPDVYQLTNRDVLCSTKDNQAVVPDTLPASLHAMQPQHVYLIDNGQMLVLWIGHGASVQWLSQVLGPDVMNPAIDPSTLPLEPPRDSSNVSQQLCSLISTLRSRHCSCYAPAFAVRQGTPLEAHVLPLLVEDSSYGQLNYVEFMQQLHRGVMSK